MFVAHKLVQAGIVFILLTTWIPGARPVPLLSKADTAEEVPEVLRLNGVNEMQQILQDKGHYRGKVDGVLGLRTRASIRAYQRADSLPVTGELDNRTAGKLGVTSESREGEETDTTLSKPSAGITQAKSFKRGKSRRSAVAPPAIRRGESGKTLASEARQTP